MKNPIIDNRIVGDKTFAIRLYKFLDSVHVNDMVGEEEKEYLLGVASRLLAYQRSTITSTSEREYFRNLGL